ncbi:MAG: hypothetical protein EBZ51_10180 [Synechococcaceae bacterium WB9_2_112]|nr:hypothetical protein [Synechococcaceae bacterium WB9_2_112]
MTFQQIAAVVAAGIVAMVYLWPLLQKQDMRAVVKHGAAIGVVFRPAAAPTQLPPVAVAMRPASKSDREMVYQFYRALADVVERDDKYVTTVGKFRDIHSASLDLAFEKTDLKGKYVGLDVAINDTLVNAIGLENVALAPEKRSALVKALRGIADAAR